MAKQTKERPPARDALSDAHYKVAWNAFKRFLTEMKRLDEDERLSSLVAARSSLDQEIVWLQKSAIAHTPKQNSGGAFPPPACGPLP